MFTCLIEWQSLGAFEKQLQKATLGHVISVLPSVPLSARKGVTPTGGVFINVVGVPQNAACACLFWLISDKNNRTLHMKTYVYLLIGLYNGDRLFSL